MVNEEVRKSQLCGLGLLLLLRVSVSSYLKQGDRASLVVQWLRVRPPMLGTWVRSLVGALRSRLLWATKAHALQLWSPRALDQHATTREKPARRRE